MRVAWIGLASVLLATTGCAGASERAESLSAARTSGPPSAPTSSPPDRPDPCSWLSQAQLDTLAGATVGVGGDGAYSDFYFPERTCSASDDFVALATVSVTVTGMPAAEWAAQAAYIVDTTPADQNAREPFDAALSAADLDDEALTNLDDAAACDFWRAYMGELGVPDSEEVPLFGGEVDPDVEGEDGQFLSGEFCADGIWGTATLFSSDAAEPEGAARLMTALGQLQFATRLEFSGSS